MDVPAVHGKRRRFTWSKEARDLVRANLRATGSAFSQMVTALHQLTGHPRDACIRFARALGVAYKKPYRPWGSHEVTRLAELSESHSRTDIATKLRRSPKAIELRQRRLGIAIGMQRDGFTKYELAELLAIRPEAIQKWIDDGWLKPEFQGTARLRRTVIHGDDFIAFCKAHPEALRTRRWNITKARLQFVFGFALIPHHSDLFKTREAKKEEAAYRKQRASADDWDEEDDGFDTEADDPQVPKAA